MKKERKEAKEMLDKWGRGESVWSIEMGGLGPGYEQTIQVLVIELVRDNLNKPLPKPKDHAFWGDETVHRINEDCHGFSGAQVGAAKQVAFRILRDGVRKTIDSVPMDRRIQVSNAWPRGWRGD